MAALKVNNKTLFSYSIMALPIAMAGIPLYIHAPDLYAKEYGVSLSIIGFTLLILRIIDAVTDPLIGIFSDAFSRYKREIFIFGLCLLGYGFYLIFHPVGGNYIAWFAATIFITSLGFSITSINLMTFGASWNNDYNDRTRISAYREGFGLLGVIIAVCLPSILSGKNSTDIFQNYSIIMMLVLASCSLIFLLFWLYRNDIKMKNKTSFSFRYSWQNILNKKHFYLVYFFSMLASAMPAVLVLIFIRDRLGLAEYAGMFLLCYFLAAAFSMLLWNKISHSYGKKKTWMLAMILAVLTFVWAFFLKENDFYPYLLVCIFSGIAFGGELALPPAIMADIMNDGSQTTDHSIMAFLSKSTLAVAAGAALPILEYTGFKTGAANNEQSLFYLSCLYALLPCGLKIISTFILYKLIIKGEKNENNNRSSGGFNA